MSDPRDDVDDLPRRRRIPPPRLLWWALIALAAAVLSWLIFGREPHRAAPAEQNAVTVQRAPVELPAAR